jgi:hypothetical protein
MIAGLNICMAASSAGRCPNIEQYLAGASAWQAARALGLSQDTQSGAGWFRAQEAATKDLLPREISFLGALAKSLHTLQLETLTASIMDAEPQGSNSTQRGLEGRIEKPRSIMSHP